MQKKVWFIVIEYTCSVFAMSLICMSCILLNNSSINGKVG